MTQLHKPTRAILATAIVIATLTACSLPGSSSTSSTTTTSPSPTTEKVGDTIKTGKLSKAGDHFWLETSPTSRLELDSYALDLNAYVGQTITVRGQYSGDTLFISKIE